MRTLVLSDVHGNLEALTAVIDHASKRQYNRVVFLGDAVGYGPNPSEVLAILKQLKAICVRGNHENFLLRFTSQGIPSRMGLAGQAIVWQMDHVSKEDLEYISSWKDRIRVQVKSAPFTAFLAVHGSPSNPDKYLDSLNVAREEFMLWGGMLCFVGHTHVPCVYSTLEGPGPNGQWVKHHPVKDHYHMTMPPAARWIVNPGSAGQPRDGDPRASYAIFDDDAMRLEVYRLEYDMHTTEQKIKAAGLPSILGDRLKLGK